MSSPRPVSNSDPNRESPVIMPYPAPPPIAIDPLRSTRDEGAALASVATMQSIAATTSPPTRSTVITRFSSPSLAHGIKPGDETSDALPAKNLGRPGCKSGLWSRRHDPKVPGSRGDRPLLRADAWQTNGGACEDEIRALGPRLGRGRSRCPKDPCG